MITRRLSHHHPQSARDVFLELVEWTSADHKKDSYGMGEVIENFEKEIATLLGKEAARFMPSGTMAQQIALRLWCEEKSNFNIAFHPTAHLEMHEKMAYAELHGMKASLVGDKHELFTLNDLKAIDTEIAVLLIELPQREIGGYLPSWEELCDIVSWARQKDIRLHMDGARLWECQPFYDRPYAEIAALFDSVYVSFYKGIGGIAGAALAGTSDFIDDAKIWQRRHGGNLPSLYPYVLAAQKGIEDRLPKMALYHQKAVEIIAALQDIPQLAIFPDRPHTNMAHLYLKGDREKLMEAEKQIRESEDIILFYGLRDGKLGGYHMLEFTVGDSTLDLDPNEVRDLFLKLFALAEE